MATSTGDWVEAGPFRAHLRHLMAVGGLSADEVAAVAGLPPRNVHHLLNGRSGRWQRRISPGTAARLLEVSTSDVASLRWCLTPVEPAREACAQLRAAGWVDEEVAARARLSLAELAALGHEARCSRLLTVRLVSLARGLPDAWRWEDELDDAA